MLPEDINLPRNPLTNWMARHWLRFFGWANWGYTGSSTEGGLLQVEPRANRFGRSGLLNQAAFVLSGPLLPRRLKIAREFERQARLVAGRQIGRTANQPRNLLGQGVKHFS